MGQVIPFDPNRAEPDRTPEPLWREVLGRRLRDIRRAKGERLVDVAARAGVSPQYLSEMERGRKEPSSEMIAAVCGALYGYDTGIISGALLSITDEFGLDHRMQEIVTAAILAGAVIGALATSWLSERIGRKLSVMGVSALFTLGAIACAMAPSHSNSRSGWSTFSARCIVSTPYSPGRSPTGSALCRASGSR